MTAKYYAILTNQGAAKLAAATALGTQIHITQMAVGDGNGSLPTPDATQTQLLNQKRIGAVNTLTVDAANANQVIAEQVIPENEGGYWIREMGLFDDDGVLIAIANCPETYKPLLQEGSGRTQTIRMALIVSSTAAVTLKIDPSVVLATRKYVDDKVIEVKAYSDDLMKQHVAASNPHTQYPLILNALQEMATAGLVNRVHENLNLSAIVLAGTATGQLANYGYLKIPVLIANVKKEVIIQWMSGATNTTNGTDAIINWPIPFPTACLSAQVTFNEGSGPFSDITTPVYITARSLNTITIRSYTGAANGVDILGIGF